MRVRRDDLVTFQVDGTHGSAVAGLHDCWTQHRVDTPRAGLEPRPAADDRLLREWQEVPDNEAYDNGFKAQWEVFIRHVVEDAPFPYGPDRGRQGRAARRAGPEELGRR